MNTKIKSILFLFLEQLITICRLPIQNNYTIMKCSNVENALFNSDSRLLSRMKDEFTKKG